MSSGKNEFDIVVEYRKKQELYFELEQIVKQKIDALIAEEDFFVMAVNSRVKDEKSLKGKLTRKGGKYTEISQITDVCGFRIICYFEETVDMLAQALRRTFSCDEKNSIDKREALSPTQFGYLSLHMICKLKKGEVENEELSDIPFEIQMRTVLQHAWAEIEHDLGYKSEFGIPRPIRRNFSRVAGLLEIADKQFSELRRDARQYTKEVIEKISENDCDEIMLDFSSLKEYLRHNMLIVDFANRLKDELNLEIEFTESTGCLKQLIWMNIYTLGDLNELLFHNIYFVFDRIEKLVEFYELDIMSSSMIIKFACEGELIRRNEPLERVQKFYEVTMEDDARVSRAVASFQKLIKNENRS